MLKTINEEVYSKFPQFFCNPEELDPKYYIQKRLPRISMADPNIHYECYTVIDFIKDNNLLHKSFEEITILWELTKE